MGVQLSPTVRSDAFVCEQAHDSLHVRRSQIVDGMHVGLRNEE